MDEILQQYNIVIIDDEPIVTSNLKTLLMLENYPMPNIFNSPVKALEYVRNNKIDLVISDFFMPEMNGIEFLKEVKKIHDGATLLLLTGYADKESAIKAINEVGLYRYLEKPWDNEDLLLCIKNGLERSHLKENLEEKIRELSETKKQLEESNEKLEKIVKERTADLCKTNYKLSAVINYCADGIITVTKEGIISHSNPAFLKICGMSEIKSRNISEICISETEEPINRKLDPDKDILLRNYKIENKAMNKFIPVEISFAPIISDEDNEIRQFVGVIRDITAQHELEILRDDFIATLTHDSRTPLLAAIQTLKFFVDGTLGDLTEKQQTFLETMILSNQDMLGLVNALLEVYKYESGQLVLCKDNFVFKDLIDQCTREIQSLLVQKNLKLILSGVSNERIYGDKQEIKRVISNFLGNAIKHTHQNGDIRIMADFNDENIVISVEDTGIGIPENDIPKLFNRFSQGTGTKRSTSTGLGLYLSRQIVEAHGGKIWLESKVNVGSKFKFSLPREKSIEYI